MDLANEVKQDIENRIIKGVQTYGERLKPFNGRDALLDAYEESLDMTLYLKQALTEKQAIQVQAKVKVNFVEDEKEVLKKLINSKIDELSNLLHYNNEDEDCIEENRLKEQLSILEKLVSKISA